MDTDELEPIKKIKKIDFDELSIEELKNYILEMETEIKKCHEYINSKENDKLKAEELFK
jgi:sensor histidine kinase YesM